MTVHLSALLIFAGLTGIYSITVSTVSVKAGDSISIPCLYESKYTQHVKYLCQPSARLTCFCTVKTNQPRGSGKYSISDDKHQRIFTVTINDLMETDNHYWCVVEINYGPDVMKDFHLLVTKSLPKLSVDHQEISAFNGDDVTIHCYYTVSGENQWCRLGVSCVKEPSGSINGTKVTINANISMVFTVTMSRVRIDSSGWYFCAKGLLQMPVHVTVKERATTTTRPSTAFSTTPELVHHTSVLAQEETTTVQEGNSESIYLESFLICLSVLIFIATVPLFIWLKFKGCS